MAHITRRLARLRATPEYNNFISSNLSLWERYPLDFYDPVLRDNQEVEIESIMKELQEQFPFSVCYRVIQYLPFEEELFQNILTQNKLKTKYCFSYKLVDLVLSSKIVVPDICTKIKQIIFRDIIQISIDDIHFILYSTNNTNNKLYFNSWSNLIDYYFELYALKKIYDIVIDTPIIINKYRLISSITDFLHNDYECSRHILINISDPENKKFYDQMQTIDQYLSSDIFRNKYLNGNNYKYVPIIWERNPEYCKTILDIFKYKYSDDFTINTLVKYNNQEAMYNITELRELLGGGSEMTCKMSCMFYKVKNSKGEVSYGLNRVIKEINIIKKSEPINFLTFNF